MAKVSKRTWTYKGQEKTAWVVRYKADGTHASRQFERRHDADRFRREVEREQDDGIHVRSSQALSIKRVCEEFTSSLELRVLEGTMDKNTLQKINNITNTRIIVYLGEKTFKTLLPSDVEDFLRKLRAKRLTSASCRTTLAQLRRIEEFARRRRYCMSTTVADTIGDMALSRDPKVKTFDLETINVLFAAVEADDTRVHAHYRKTIHGRATLRCMVYLAAFCGLRLGEIRALQSHNVDFDSRVIRIRHSMTLDGRIKEPKTKAGMRDFPMSDAVYTLLSNYMQTFMRKHEDGLVFTTSLGGQIHATDFHKHWWGPLLKRAGFAIQQGGRKAYNFHSLRHFCASWMVMQGVPLTDVAALLGHTRVSTTMQTYAHSITGQDRKLAFVQRSATALLTLAPPSVAQGLRMSA